MEHTEARNSSFETRPAGAAQGEAEYVATPLLPSRRRLQPLQACQIIRNPGFEIVLRLVAQLLARARNVVHPGCRIGEAIKIQAAADFHLRARNELLDDALEVAQRHANA